MRCVFLIGVFWAPLVFLSAQTSRSLEADSGVVQEHWEPGLKSQYMQWLEARKKEKTKGFRVQLVSLNGAEAREELQRLRKQFLQVYPDWPIYEKWEAPNWKLRVGDFSTALDATLFRQQVKGLFPQAYVVIDDVKPWVEP